MFYKFLAAFLAAIALIYLGNLSVWVKVLSAGLIATLAVITAIFVAGGGIYLWKRYRSSSVKQLAYKQ